MNKNTEIQPPQNPPDRTSPEQKPPIQTIPKQKSSKKLWIILSISIFVIIIATILVFLIITIQKGPEYDSSECKGVLDESEKNNCYSNLVINQNKDISICKKITDNEEKRQCLQSAINGIIETSEDSSPCKRADFLKNDCYYLFAQAKQDPSICEHISDRNVVTECINNMA